MHSWQTGEVLVFDGNLMHEVANLSAAEPRVVLVVDALMTPDEERYVNRATGSRAGPGSCASDRR